MTAAEARAWEYAHAWTEELVGWDVSQEGPLPPPTGHARILLGPHLERKTLRPGEWLRLLGGRDAFLASCGPEDIVWVPLMDCCTNLPAWSWRDQQCSDIADHVSLIHELAPRVAGIMLGNMGPEFVAHEGPGERFRQQEAVDLIRRFGEIASRAGAKLFVGTVDWTVLLDAYGVGAIRQACLEVDATQVCYCGYTLSPRCYWDPANDHYGKQVLYQVARDGEAPAQRVGEYLASAPFWSDVNWLEGLSYGNATELARMGFERGCL